MKKIDSRQHLQNICTGIGIVIIAAFLVFGVKKGLFTSKERMQEYIEGFGFFAPLIFIMVQALQVVIPILPGTIGCIIGPVIFGPLYGFLYNYIGIIIGSICAFLLGRKFGQPLVLKIVGQKIYQKYSYLLDQQHGFCKVFAGLILFPLAPDDYLCYLAGLSDLKLCQFIPIILLGKPPALILYCVLLSGAYHIVVT